MPVRVPDVVGVLSLEIRHAAVHELRPPHRQRFVGAHVETLEEEGELMARVVAQMAIGVKTSQVAPHAQREGPRRGPVGRRQTTFTQHAEHPLSVHAELGEEGTGG